MDAFTPLHLFLIAAIAAVIVGPERVIRLAAKAVGWLGAYRRIAGRLTPAGLAQALAQVALSPADEAGPRAGPDA